MKSHPGREKAVITRTRSFARFMRRSEWLGVCFALLVLSGAIFPLMLSNPDGGLSDAARGKLRMISLPGLLIGLGLLACHPAAALRAARCNIAMLALLFLPLASVLWSIGPSVTLRRAVALILSMALAYVLAIRFTPRQQILLLGGVLGGATCLSLLAGIVLPGMAFMPGEPSLRGLFLHKNVLGWMACLTVGVGLVARQDPDPRLRRMGWWLVLAGFAAVLWSGSATSLLATLTALATARAIRAVAARRGIRRLVLILFYLVVIVTMAALLTLALVPFLEFIGKDATLTGRVPLWQAVDAQIVSQPLLGFGYGAFWDPGNVTAWQIWASQGWQAPHAHNGYRDLLLGTGLVGLTLFLVTTGFALAQGVTLCTRAPDEGWALPILIITISLVLNLSESIFLKQNDLLWVLYMMATISISCRHAELHRPLPRQIRLAMTAT
jgi:exopolysaccharide production protein ExoQ